MIWIFIQGATVTVTRHFTKGAKRADLLDRRRWNVEKFNVAIEDVCIHRKDQGSDVSFGRGFGIRKRRFQMNVFTIKGIRTDCNTYMYWRTWGIHYITNLDLNMYRYNCEVLQYKVHVPKMRNLYLAPEEYFSICGRRKSVANAQTQGYLCTRLQIIGSCRARNLRIELVTNDHHNVTFMRITFSRNTCFLYTAGRIHPTGSWQLRPMFEYPCQGLSSSHMSGCHSSPNVKST
jgi:hypothetical protein